MTTTSLGRFADERETINVLVVDDSAVVRQTVAAVLGASRRFHVTAAADPLIAFQKIGRARPDVILLDLEMPKMDGLTFLEKLMAENPIPVVICSGLTNDSSDIAVRALEAGAVEVVTKPRLGVRDFLHDSALMLIDALEGAVRARHGRARKKTRPQRLERLSADAVLPAPTRPRLEITSDRVIAIGASTGGTEALRTVLEKLPPDTPGLVIVQHMPEMFTAAFAKRLAQLCPIEVKEAADGDRVLAGRALIAPGNRHTLLVQDGAHYAVHVRGGPLVSRHRPSVDVLFRSVAQHAGVNAVGVIMTGMGDDGAAGMVEMREAGAVTLAQDEESCVVFGMPREAILRGAVDEVVRLDDLSAAIVRCARVRSRGRRS